MEKLFKLAEFGELMLEENPCHWDYQYNDGDCYGIKCSKNEACKLRNEIFNGGK